MTPIVKLSAARVGFASGGEDQQKADGENSPNHGAAPVMAIA